jgi:hypothetical protein
MARVGCADQTNRDRRLGEAKRQGGRRRRPASLTVAGKYLSGDDDRAALRRLLQVDEQVLTVWTKHRFNYFNARIGNDTG